MDKDRLKKWIRSIVSAVVGAVLSFGVTFGIVSEQKAGDLHAQLAAIDEKTEQLVKALEAKDIETAFEIAKELSLSTKAFIGTSKEVLSQIGKNAETGEADSGASEPAPGQAE